MTQSRRGISLVEGVISMAIVAGLGASVANVLGSAATARAAAERDAIAATLAHSLLAEIIAQGDIGYNEPGTGNRRDDFDNVWDYDGWDASPPQYPQGIELTGRDDWRHRIEVMWVTPASPTTVSATSTGLVRIVVDVLYKDRVVRSIASLRRDVETRTAHGRDIADEKAADAADPAGPADPADPGAAAAPAAGAGRGGGR